MLFLDFLLTSVLTSSRFSVLDLNCYWRPEGSFRFDNFSTTVLFLLRSARMLLVAFVGTLWLAYSLYASSLIFTSFLSGILLRSCSVFESPFMLILGRMRVLSLSRTSTGLYFPSFLGLEGRFWPNDCIIRSDERFFPSLAAIEPYTEYLLLLGVGCPLFRGTPDIEGLRDEAFPRLCEELARTFGVLSGAMTLGVSLGIVLVTLLRCKSKLC